MKTQELINKYINFFLDRGHVEIPNVSLIPEGDSTLLFVNSGMFPLVPYLLGETHPSGTKLVNVQRAVRFEDLDDIGDRRHTLGFHMLGNWSLGEYFKKEQLNWFYTFLIEELGLDPNRLYSTVFEGDEITPRDEESIALLQGIFEKYGIEAKLGERIFPYGKKSNWWQRGDAVGELGGPDSETFYYFGEGTPTTNPEDDEENFLEIGNSVFLQYRRTEDGWEELPQKNVDFGGGVERLALVLQNKHDIFETDNFWPLIEEIQRITGKDYYEDDETTKSMRILADHIRTCVFLAMDGVAPSNKDQGYVLRRLIRRMVRYGKKLGFTEGVSSSLVSIVCKNFNWLYPQLSEKKKDIEDSFISEEKKFEKTLIRGEREIQKIFPLLDVSDTPAVAKSAFDLYQSVGYPYETFIEDLVEHFEGVPAKVITAEIEILIHDHQNKSRQGAEQKFKGGLADQSAQVVRYHTATHLLQQALRDVLGTHVKQLGSNITGERLRFDFANGHKLTPEEISRVEKSINDVIKSNKPVNFKIMPIEDAKKSGALYMENEEYPDNVKVYYVGGSLESAYSKEFCGGPHVESTSDIGELTLYKQDKIGEGKLRVYLKSV